MKRRLALTIAALALLALDGALAAGITVGTYGRPGATLNGGVYVSKRTTCAGVGLELWGHPGPFRQTDC